MYKTIKVEQTDWGYALILNRPEKLNALSQQMITEIHQALHEIKEKSPHLLLIKGEGTSFCSGHDLSDPMPDVNNEENQKHIIQMQEITRLITELPCPVIAAIQGYAIGAGSEIALNCDLIYASEDAVFGFPELKLGLSITQAASYFLPRTVGLVKAKEFLFFGEHISAHEFKELGLINDVFPTEDFTKKLEEKILILKERSLRSLATTKKLFRKGMDISIKDSLHQEMQALNQLVSKSQ